MGRSRTRPNRGRSDERGKSRISKSFRYDDSDESTIYSDPECKLRSGHSDYRRQAPQGIRRSSRHLDRRADNDYEDDDWDSDYSYDPTPDKVHKQSYRKKSRSKPKSIYHLRDVGSDSDESSVRDIGKRNFDRSDRNRGRGSFKGRRSSKKSIASDEGSILIDHNDSDGSSFSTRIEIIRREYDDSSSSSDEEAANNRHSHRHGGNAPRNLQHTTSDSNIMQSSIRSLGSAPSLGSSRQLTRSMNSISPAPNTPFNSRGNMPLAAPHPSNPQVRRSGSSRSLGGTGQSFRSGPSSDVLMNNSFRSVGHDQISARISNSNFQGKINPQLSLGSANMMTPMSARAINPYPIAREQMNRLSQNDIMQTPVSSNSMRMQRTPARSPGGSNMLFDASKQRLALISGASNKIPGNGLHGSSMYPQGPPLSRAPPQNNLVSNNALIDTSMNRQQVELRNMVSQRVPRKIDGMIHPSIQSLQSSEGSLNNSNPSLNTKTVYAQGLVLGIGNNIRPLNTSSTQLHPSVRMNANRPLENINGSSNAPLTQFQPKLWMNGNAPLENNITSLNTAYPNVGTSTNQQQYVPENAPTPNKRSKKVSNTSESVMVMSGGSENTSGGSSHSRRPRRSSAPRSLADQIYARSRNDRYNDSQSVGSYADPPGVDCNSQRGSNRMSFKNISDEVFEDDEESYYVSNDPPDKFDELEERSHRSLGEREDQRGFYKGDPSSSSSFDDFDKYRNYKVPLAGNAADADDYRRDSRGSLCDSSVSSDGFSKGRNSVSRYSSELAFEYDQLLPPSSDKRERKLPSSRKYEFESRRRDGVIVDGVGHNENILSLPEHKEKSNSDDSTTTTDTMTHDVPSVIISRDCDSRHTYTDFDSDDDLTKSTTDTVEKIRNDYISVNRQEKNGQRRSRPKKTKATEEHSKTVKRKKDRRNDRRKDEVSKGGKNNKNSDALRKRERSKKKHVDVGSRSSKTESSKNKERLKKKRNEDLEHFSTRASRESNGNRRTSEYVASKHETKTSSKNLLKSKPKESRNRSRQPPLDKKVCFNEDKTVVTLIDQLKSFEVGQY